MKKETKVKSIKKGHIDWIIFLPVIGLMLFSLVFVYSASAPYSALKHQDTNKIFIDHLIRVIFGIITLVIFSKINYHVYKTFAKPIFYFGIILLVVVLITPAIHNVHRWIDLGIFSLQPVEYMKFAMVIYFSHLLVEKQKVIKDFQETFVPFIVWTAIICILIALQPNFSNLALIFLIAMIIMFVGNVNFLHIICSFLGAILAGGVYLFSAPYRIARIKAFFQNSDSSSAANQAEQVIAATKYQAEQALIALGNGGIFGLGPGQSKQNHLFLPESHVDFIFSIIGEEYGFLGLLCIIIAFVVIIWRSLIIAQKAPDNFGYFLAIGIVVTLAIYFVANAAVNTALLPTTGIPLPFLSYGGTAILIYAASAGILLNISSQANVYPLEEIYLKEDNKQK